MLSRTDILNEMDSGNIVIRDFDLLRLGTNSYDLLLGDTFFEVIYDAGQLPMYIGPLRIAEGEYINLPVGATLLGHTKDYVSTINGIVGIIWSPSTVARRGISVCHNAGLGDDGFSNYWTLEMTAHVRRGVPRLTPGQRIAQIVFFRLETASGIEYSGQYNKNDCDWPLCMLPKEDRHRVIPFHSKVSDLRG